MKAACAELRVNLHGGISKMAHRKPRVEMRSSLVHAELERIAENIPLLDAVELPLKLALHRLHFLSWQERLLILENIHCKEDFLSLGLAEIESLFVPFNTCPRAGHGAHMGAGGKRC